MRRYSAAGVLAALVSVIFLSFMVGCSGTGSAVAPVTQIVLTPSSLSLNTGQVVQLVATPENSTGGTVVADVSFSSSNTALVTVSPAGYVCAGIWDSNFIVCNPNPGVTGIGQSTITATSGSITNTAQVNVHLQADRIVVNPVSGCVSMGATPTYTASVYNTTSLGCSTTNPCNITSSVGTITYTSTDLQVMANNITTGVLTATNPGSTNIYATVAGLNSLPTPELVCPVASIKIHDANGTGTSFTLSPAGTQSLTADVVDTNGVSIVPLLNWASSPSGSSSVTGATGAVTATVTAGASGTAIITATCSTPDCNRNVGAQYSQNVITVTTTGSTSTTAFAASTNSLTLVPIAVPGATAGTAIALPFTPNSMVSSLKGDKLYLGSSSGLMTVDPVALTVNSNTAIIGTILGISPDGNYLLISNPATPAVNLYYISGSSITLTQAVTTNAGAFTPDSRSVSFLVGQQVYYETIFPSTTITGIPYVPDSLDVSATGSLTYITSSASHAIDVRTTCNQADQQTLAANNPTLVAHIPNDTGAVVADSPSVDVVTTGTIGPGCPPAPPSTVNSYNLNAGSFNARQFLFATDSSKVWMISDLTSVIGFNLSTLAPTTIPLANGAQAYNGGITVDGATIYVGASDNTVHVLNTSSSADTAQVAVALKDANSNIVAPNLVVVLPH